MPDPATSSYQTEAENGPDRGTLKRYGIIAAGVALLIVVIGIGIRILNHGKLEQIAEDSAVQTVAVVTPTISDASGPLVLPGNVQAFNSAAIFARTNGYVRRWLADIGDHVSEGQTLAILDAPEVDQQLAQAQADYQTAVANQRLAATTAQRWSTMLAKDAVSRQETDEKAGDLAAKNALANAALANVKRLRALQGFTRLSAPFSGIVTSRSAQIGALVVSGNAAAQPLFTVSDTHRMRIYVRVPQGYSAQVHQGGTATLTLPEYPDKTFPAVVTRSAGAVDAQSGAVLVELQADNSGGALKPGAFSQVSFKVQGQPGSVKVPGSVVLLGDDGPTVAVVDNQGRVTIKPIKISRDQGNVVEISSGLNPRDRVIDSPPDGIRSGDKVKVQAPGKGEAKAAE